MAVDAGTARGKLDLNAAGFFDAIHSAVSELHNLESASSSASSGVVDFEKTLGGAGSDLSNVGNAAKGAASGINNVGTSSESAGGKTGGFGDKLKTAWERMKDAIPDAEKIAEKLQTIGNKAQSAGKQLSKYITAPLAAIGVYSVKTSMTFEKAMSQVQATMGATKDDMVNLEAAAKKMGETTQYTNTEAAQALNYLALAGYNEEQMIAALPNVLNLAAAGNMDLADASDMLTDGLSALNLASSDSTVLMKNMETMVDQMARTASRSNTSVAQLGDSILTVGGTASYLSGGLAEVNQVIGLLADRGIKASEAGTHLRNIILAMNPVTKDAEEGFVRVGLGVRDAEGNFKNLAYDAEGTMKPLSEIFQMLQKGMSTMSDMEKQQTLVDIFHRTDLAAANALIGTSADRWEELGNEIRDSAGAGSQMAATQLDNLSGQMTLLKSKIEAAATTIGEKLAPVISNVVEWIGQLVDKFAQLDPETQEFIIKAGLIAAAFGPVLKVFGMLISGAGKVIVITSKVISAVSSMFKFLAPVVTKGISALLAPATLGVGSLLSGIGAFIAGYGIGTMIYDAIGPEIDEILHPIFDFFVDLWEDIVTFFTESIPEFFETVGETVTEGIEAIGQFFKDIATAIWDFVVEVWDNITSVLSTVASWIYDYVIQPILAVVVPIVTKIYEICLKIVEIIKTVFGVIGKWVYDYVITPIVNFVKGLASTLVDLFKGAWEGIKAVWNSVVSFFQGIWDGIKNIFAPVGEWFSNIFKGAWNGIKTAWGAVTDFFSGIWSGIKKVFSKVGDFFYMIFKGAWNRITYVWENVKDFFQGVWDGIKSIFSIAASAIADTFSGAFKAAFNGVMTLVEGVVNFFIDAINGVIDLINIIPGVDIGLIDRLSLPRLSVGLDYVPYDDYQALLHKGERVLTKEENEEYTNNRGTGGGDTYIFNSPEPIDEIEAANQLKRVKQELAEGF